MSKTYTGVDCIFITFAFIIGVTVGGCIEDQVSKTEAVKVGYAEWIPDASGWSTFSWKPLPESCVDGVEQVKEPDSDRYRRSDSFPDPSR